MQKLVFIYFFFFVIQTDFIEMLFFSYRKFVRLGEYDTETNPDCVEIEDDKDCNETPFDSPPESKNSKMNLNFNI